MSQRNYRIALATAGATLASAIALAFSTGPPADRAAVCGARQSCKDVGCHDDFPLNSGTAVATLKLDLGPLPTTYKTGELLRFVLSVTDPDPSSLRFGFELAAVTNCPFARQAGSFTILEPERTRIASANSIDFVEHTCAVLNDPARCGYLPALPGTISWTFDWQAPPAYAGPIDFYFAINAANGSSDPLGDYISIFSATLDPACPPRVATLSAIARACDPAMPGVIKVDLQWQAVPYATGYRLYRTESKPVLQDPAALGATTVAACDDPPPGAIHYYTLTGLCADASDGPL